MTELSGKKPAYRDAPAVCPGCDERMRKEPTSGAEVDVCDACGGLWLDWFDGEVQAVAVEAEAARLDRGSPPPGVLGTRGGKGSSCPRCRRALSAENYRFADARKDELISDVEIFRCAECAGCFVPRSSAHLLLERVREERATSVFEALVALLRRAFGRASE